MVSPKSGLATNDRAVPLSNPGGTKPTGGTEAQSPKSPLRAVALYLLVAGFAALLVVPFLPWLNYGPESLLFPPQVSLVFLFERGQTFTGNLLLYLAGVAVSGWVVAFAGRPVSYQGMPSAVFPVFILIVTTMTWVQSGYQVYPQAFTLGMFTALLGSFLLEASYFSYRSRPRLAGSPQGEIDVCVTMNVELTAPSSRSIACLTLDVVHPENARMSLRLNAASII